MTGKKSNMKRSSRNAQDPGRRDHQPGGEVQEGSLAASSETTVRSQGRLWKRVQVQLLMRHGTSRLFLVQSCVVIRFAVHLFLLVTFSLQVWGLCEESGELVILLWCSAGLPGETSETRQQLHEENSAQADWTDHSKGICIKPLYEECIVPVQGKRLKKNDLAYQARNVRVGSQRVCQKLGKEPGEKCQGQFLWVFS